MYNPDAYTLLRIENTNEIFYKVFASWRGGYLDGDSWRMNSGITKTERIPYNSSYKEGCLWNVYGESGSCYQVYSGSYDRLGLYNEGVIQDLIDRSQVLDDCRIVRLSAEEAEELCTRMMG